MTLKEVSDGKTACILLLLSAITAPFAVLLNAWALTVLWSWFVVPLGAPQLGLMGAAGLMLLKGYLLARRDLASEEIAVKKAKENATGEWIMGTALRFGSPLLAVGIGWVYVMFFGGLR